MSDRKESTTHLAIEEILEAATAKIPKDARLRRQMELQILYRSISDAASDLSAFASECGWKYEDAGAVVQHLGSAMRHLAVFMRLVEFDSDDGERGGSDA